MRKDTSRTEEGVWCVVANIKGDHPYGERGEETRSGTRQFRSGTKVYIAGCYPGACDAVVCIGLHRKSRKFITCVINVAHVENFRPKMVYHPEVVRRIKEDQRCWFNGREDAENYAEGFLIWQKMNRRGTKPE